jgi:hypothetical protein
MPYNKELDARIAQCVGDWETTSHFFNSSHL